MPRYFTIIFLLLACFSSCKKKPADVLAGIKKEYAEINKKQKDYTAKHIDDITHSGGGTITGFYKDEELKKIIAQHYADTCRTFTEYYFEDGMLIYILKQNYVYNMPVSYTEEKAKERNDSIWYDDKKTRLEISSYYFDENKLIKWDDAENGDMQPQTAEFIDKESELWAETVILVKQLREQ